MLRAIILACILIPIARSAKCDQNSADDFSCVLFENGDEVVQLWALANRKGIDVQSFADRHLPVTYVHEIDLVLSPPRNISVLQLSIAEIATKKSLITLDLSGTIITNDDIRTLSTLPKLESLVLDWTDVTDGCFEHIRKCKNLRILSIHGCDVTEGAAARLQYSIPGLVRIMGEGHTVISMQDRN